jgi:hypothetical protein
MPDLRELLGAEAVRQQPELAPPFEVVVARAQRRARTRVGVAAVVGTAIVAAAAVLLTAVLASPAGPDSLVSRPSPSIASAAPVLGRPAMVLSVDRGQVGARVRITVTNCAPVSGQDSLTWRDASVLQSDANQSPPPGPRLGSIPFTRRGNTVMATFTVSAAYAVGPGQLEKLCGSGAGTGIRNVAATFTVLPAPGCRTSQLALSLGRGGVALGTSYRQVDFQNRGPTACSLTGYPGLSFTDRVGHQLGPPALPVNLTNQPITTVTLAPGGFANASVGIVSPGNYQTTPQPSSSTCRPAHVSYLRVYPPNQRNAVLLAFPADVCTTASGRALVTPSRPGRSDTAVG